MSGYELALAEWATSLKDNDVPDEVRRKAVNLLVDALGIAIAASSLNDIEGIVSQVVKTGGAGQCGVIGRSEKLGVAEAAMLNAMLIHRLDYDDTHLRTIIHASSTIVATALSVGEWVGARGSDMVTAMVAGYEVMTRCGLATRPAELSSMGRLPSGVFGPIGSAVVASKLIGLDATSTAVAIRLAASSAPIVGSGAKIRTVGWAANSGVWAALHALTGAFEPDDGVLEGEKGLYVAVLGHDAAFPEQITAELGTRWETLSICPKTYACCHSHQGFMDAARELVRTNGVRSDELEVVVCKVPEFTWRNRLQPLEQKRRPATPYAAKFSVPFGVAVTLIRGEAGLEAFTEHTIRDKEILALVDRIEFELEPERFSEFPAYYSGWIEATTADGSTLVSQVAYNRGSDRNPLSDADYDVKFREAASTVLTGDAGEAILRTARSIESSTVADLLSVLTG